MVDSLGYPKKMDRVLARLEGTTRKRSKSGEDRELLEITGK